MDALGARFDWYESTHDGLDDGRVARALAVTLPGASLSRGKGRNGYATCEVVQRGEDVLAQVYGGSSREGEVHIVATSAACDEVVPVIRRLWPDHRVSRADSSVDFAADFEALDVRAVAFAKARGIKYSIITDSDGGATRRLGSPSSEVFARVYKKSEQLRALHPDRAHEIPAGVVRAECVVRPGKREVKSLVASMGADGLWGLSQWSQVFAIDLLGFEAERVPTHFRRPSDFSRMIHFLGKQYGPALQRRAEAVGRPQAIAELLDAVGLSDSAQGPF